MERYARMYVLSSRTLNLCVTITNRGVLKFVDARDQLLLNCLMWCPIFHTKLSFNKHFRIGRPLQYIDLMHVCGHHTGRTPHPLLFFCTPLSTHQPHRYVQFLLTTVQRRNEAMFTSLVVIFLESLNHSDSQSKEDFTAIFNNICFYENKSQNDIDRSINRSHC